MLSHAKNQGSHSKIRHLAGNEAAEDMVNNAMLLSNSKQVACSEKERIKELPLDHLLQTGKSNLESAHSETTRCDAGSSHSLEVADASGTTHSAKIPDDLVPGQNI